jgi:CRISPR/Cas system CSM-associated protein Csm3 (group 7 of RAMP superfamily)
MMEPKLDFYATYHGLTVKDASRIGGEREMDVYARLQLLALTLPDVALKEVGRSMYRDLVHRPGGGSSTYDRELIARRQEQMERLGLSSPALERLSLMPDCSFAIQFTLTLQHPYLSKDDEPLYIIDNPVAKDRVFRVPMVRSSSWKGALRSAAWLVLVLQDDDEQVVNLFGSEKGEKEERLKAGRLVFYTTFFDRVGLEIINPHDRQRKVGINPILIESVPAGARGTFSLLYAPFDLLTAPQTERVTKACADLETVSSSLRALVLDLGFSAKRTSGYGVIHDRDLSGSLRLRKGEKTFGGTFSTFTELDARVREACDLWRGG